MSGEDPMVPAVQDVGAVVTTDGGDTTTVAIGIQISPDAMSRLAEREPEKLLGLAQTIDDNQYKFHSQRSKERHEAVKLQHAGMAELARLDHADRQSSRLHEGQIFRWALGAIIAVIGMVLVAFAATGKIEDAKSLIETVVGYVVTFAGGYGLGSSRFKQQESKD